MKNKKIAGLLAIVLLISMAGCGGNAGVDDVPPSNSIESQAPPETPETPTEPTESTDQTQDPPQSEEPTDPTQEPAQEPREEPKETTPTSEEPTQEPTTPPATTAPVHTHSYSNSVTKQATCDTNGIITYTCSCGDSYTEAIKATGHNYSSTVVTEPTCVEVGGRLYTCANCGNVYTETIPANGHNYVTKQEVVEHSEQVQIGTKTVNDYAQVTIYGCRACDFTTYDPEELQRHQPDELDSGMPCAGVGWWSKTTTEVVGTHEEPVYSNRSSQELVTIRVCSVCGHQE